MMLSLLILVGIVCWGSSADLVQALTDASFDATVLSPTSKPHFIQFMAPWCHYCRLLEPVWMDLAEQLQSSTNFAKVDCTEQTMLRARYQIMGFPTLLLFHHGRHIEFRGDRSQSNLKAFLKRNHALSSGNLTLHTTYYRGKAEPIRLLMAELGMVWSEKHYALPPLHSPCYWRQTGGCTPNGPREADHDRHCHSAVPAGASGYCECADGSRGHEGSCEHGEFRCSAYCVDPNAASKPTAEIFDTEHWLEEGAVFPPGKELPLLVTAEGVALKGTLATMRTLARSAASPLYRPQDVVAIEEILSVVDTFLQRYYFLLEPPPFLETSPIDFRSSLRDLANPLFSEIEKRLTKQGSYLTGKQFTLADLYAFHVLSLTLGVLPACLEEHPKTKDYFIEIGMRDSLTAYLSSLRRLPHPNSNEAFFGNINFPEDPAANPFSI
jgi:thiol-disulfide isomerase/thioredoxin/glutathione S-transferase